jgi:hypothetical protein
VCILGCSSPVRLGKCLTLVFWACTDTRALRASLAGASGNSGLRLGSAFVWRCRLSSLALFLSLPVSFFDSPKNETQKSDPSVRASSSAAPFATEQIQTREQSSLRQGFVLFVALAARSRRRTAQGREVQHVNPQRKSRRQRLEHAQTLRIDM